MILWILIYIAALAVGLVELFSRWPADDVSPSETGGFEVLEIFALANILLAAGFYVGVQTYAPSRVGYELDLFLKKVFVRFKQEKRRFDQWV